MGKSLEDIIVERYAAGDSAIEALKYLRDQGLDIPYVEVKQIYLRIMNKKK